MSDETAVVSVDYRKRKVMLFGDVDESSAAQIIHALCELNDSSFRKAGQRREDPIEFWIQSHGGSTSCAHAITDVMQHVVDADILTVGLGRVCSAATLPLLLGDQRLVLPSCEIVMHGCAQPLMADGGRPDAAYLSRLTANAESARASAAYTNTIMVRVLVEKCHWNEAQALAMVNSGTDHVFAGYAQILGAGLADGVIGENLGA